MVGVFIEFEIPLDAPHPAKLFTAVLGGSKFCDCNKTQFGTTVTAYKTMRSIRFAYLSLALSRAALMALEFCAKKNPFRL